MADGFERVRASRKFYLETRANSRSDNPADFDSWEGDMRSRVFWCTLMYETILTQELGLPKSGLAAYESSVPLPKFTPFPGVGTQNHWMPGEKIDAFFQYHFLAQGANRIMLTRISNSLYVYCRF